MVCNAIFREAYGSVFITTLFLGFSPSIDGNTTIEVELVFNNTASPEVTISTADVLETMTTAATNTSAGGISFDPESIVVTEATLSKPFTAELTNQTTAEFQELQTIVVTSCNAIFREAYGSVFITTLFLGFSPSIDGNTTIEVELVFNNTASPEVTISTADVLETMTTAATNTSAGGISFDPESIVVTGCASDPPLCCLGRDDGCSRVCFCDVACLRIGDCCSDFNATCITGENPSCFNGCFCDESCGFQLIPDCCPDYEDTCMIEATLSKPFTAELTNQTTAEFQELQTIVVTSCNAIFREAYGSVFITTLFLGFSPSIDGNTTIEVELVFNNTASPEVTISTADVLETMTTAATNTSAGGISFDPESIVVTEATLSKPFTAELTNQTTAEFQELQTIVVTSCNAIFREAYGSVFITTLFLGFSPSIDGNTTIEVELVFNNTASPEVTISTADVLETMTTAATNTSAGGITFDPESIVVTETATSTPAPTTTTATPDPSVPTVSFTVEATLSKPFTAELTNQTTAEFQELQTIVVTSCNAIFREAYGSVFITTLFLGFSPSIDGNTTIEVELVFNNTASPEVTISTADVLETMTTAATNTSAGGISFDPESIVVTEATLSKPFTPELTDQTTAEFQELQTIVVTSCNAIFREAYGSVFITTLFLGFSPSIDGNTTIEVELVFNNTASPEVTISTADVLETMTTAATNTSAGGISFDPESIVVTEATLSKPFTAELTDQTTAEFQELQTIVVTSCNAIFREAYGSVFITTLFLGFSPSIDGNTTIEVELVFNNTASPEVTISTADVLETMTTAATNTSAGGISFDPESIVVTEATLSKPFTPELTDQTTAEFQELQTIVVTSCNAIFREAYGSVFITTLFLGFSPSIDGNTTIEVELVFNNTASPEVTISTADVLETMTTAATNTSAGGISFDPESIVVTATATATTTPTPATAPSVTTSFVTGTLTPSSTKAPITSTIISSVTPTITTDVSVPTPTVNVAPVTVTTGASSTASSTMGSTQTSSSESTTSLMTTTNPPTAPSAPAPTFSLSVTLTQTYDEQLSNPSSQQFIALQLIVVTTCNAIYRAEYGFLFIRVIVIRFRPAGGRRMANTETLLELVFNNTAPSESIPPAEEVANVLRNAPVDNSTDSLQFDATTIVVERVVTTTTTIAPTTAQPLTITAKPMATTAQPPATTAQPPTTTAQPPAPTQTTTTAAVALANVRFGFRSVRDTFTADLLNPSSAAFQDRATTITSALEPLFRRAFGSFTSLQVVTFRQGSIITTMDAKFSSAPPSDQIARVLIDAAGTITAFDIETNSITVNGIVTGGVSSGMNKSSAFIISSMALLSWLLVSS
ncbi:unnamed protein product [Boreogadus saida]